RSPPIAFRRSGTRLGTRDSDCSTSREHGSTLWAHAERMEEIALGSSCRRRPRDSTRKLSLILARKRAELDFPVGTLGAGWLSAVTGTRNGLVGTWGGSPFTRSGNGLVGTWNRVALTGSRNGLFPGGSPPLWDPVTLRAQRVPTAALGSLATTSSGTGLSRMR